MAELELAAAVEVKAEADSAAVQAPALCPPSRIRTEHTSFNAAASPATYSFAAFPSPPSGRVWEVLRVSVWPTDPYTALTADILGVITNTRPADSSAEPPFEDLLISPAAPPYVQTWSRRQTLLLPGTVLALCIKGATSSDSFSASMVVIDHDLMEFVRRLQG